MQNKRETSPYAGKTVKIISGPLEGEEYRVEDWFENVLGISWMDATGNPTALDYAIRSAQCRLPIDNQVLYGKIGYLGKAVHISEIADISTQESADTGSDQ